MFSINNYFDQKQAFCVCWLRYFTMSVKTFWFHCKCAVSFCSIVIVFLHSSIVSNDFQAKLSSKFENLLPEPHDVVESLQNETAIDSCLEDPPLDHLWLGDIPWKIKCPVGRISAVVSHCNKDLSWFDRFTQGFQLDTVEIFSKCGVIPKGAPEKSTIYSLPNVGRCDHTYAQAMLKIAEEEVENTSRTNSSDIIVFIKDNLDIHQASKPRRFGEMIRIASKMGFACYQRPIGLFSNLHLTNALGTFHMHRYDGADRTNSNHEFLSKYTNMTQWLDDLNITLPKPITPVCYGGIFAVQKSRISSLPIEIWKRLVASLSRGDNIEEGHFAERTWAGLLSNSLTESQAVAIVNQTSRINRKTAYDGGGHIGALMKRVDSEDESSDESDDDSDDDDDDV